MDMPVSIALDFGTYSALKNLAKYSFGKTSPDLPLHSDFFF